MTGLLGENGYELRFDETVTGNRSPIDTPLMDAIRGFLESGDPAPRWPGGAAASDSRWFRAAFPDCVAYGFFPQNAMDLFEAALARARRRRAGAGGGPRPGGARLLAPGAGAAGVNVPEDKLRLGGMALRNGLLVHGPTHGPPPYAPARAS